MTLIINGTDFSEDFSPYVPEFGLNRVEGPNSGTAQDGSAIIDLVDTKDTMEYTSSLLTEERYRLIRQIAKLATVTVQYDDPDTGEISSKTMIPSVGSAKRIPLLGGGNVYKSLVLTLTEK